MTPPTIWSRWASVMFLKISWRGKDRRPPVLGEVGNSQSLRLARRLRRDRLPVEPHRPGRRPLPPEQHPSDLGHPGAEIAKDAQNLTGSRVKCHVIEFPGQAESLDRQYR